MIMRHVLKGVAWVWSSCSGWRMESPAEELPPKFVLLAVPHTSNWDLVHLLVLAFRYDISLRWLGKHTLFLPPLGWFLRFFGGIAVDRSKPAERVKQIADLFAAEERFVLVIPPEGTRSWVPYWKSGFYHIAKAADVPLLSGYLDYRTKRAGVGITLRPSGDIAADMDKLRAFYADKVGCYPERQGVVRLRAEDDDEGVNSPRQAVERG